MSSAELITLIQSNDKAATKKAFDTYYSRLAPIANRYGKNQAQSDEMLNQAFNSCLNKLKTLKQPPLDLDLFMEKEFITECIAYIKNIRSEYYVSSTVYAPGEASTKSADLFDNTDAIDFKQIDNDILLKCLQQLVPSQRLIFNLHVVDGFSLPEAAALLESSEGTVKSNLEKARFNLQKSIEKTLKSSKS
jgi:RNA polymerase sigma-70 factor (ECF subfamily)